MLLLLILAVLAVIAVVATGRWDGLPDAEPERSPSGALPAGPVDRAMVDGLRFSTVLRGYRMVEVDDVLDRLLEELDQRDARIAELTGQSTGEPTVAGAISGSADEQLSLDQEA